MKKKIDWTNHSIEFVTVVVGILLAFWLNSYNLHLSEVQQAEQYLNSIENEIKVNLKEVSIKLPYHEKMLQKLIENPLNATIQLKVSRLTDYAWDLSKNNIFRSHVDYDTYYLLADAYSAQQQLRQHNQHTGETMTNLSAISPLYMIAGGQEGLKIVQDSTFRKQMRMGWVPILQDMVSYEEIIKEKYELTLKHLSKQDDSF